MSCAIPGRCFGGMNPQSPGPNHLVRCPRFLRRSFPTVTTEKILAWPMPAHGSTQQDDPPRQGRSRSPEHPLDVRHHFVHAFDPEPGAEQAASERRIGENDTAAPVSVDLLDRLGERRGMEDQNAILPGRYHRRIDRGHRPQQLRGHAVRRRRADNLLARGELRQPSRRLDAHRATDAARADRPPVVAHIEHSLGRRDAAAACLHLDCAAFVGTGRDRGFAGDQRDPFRAIRRRSQGDAGAGVELDRSATCKGDTTLLAHPGAVVGAQFR